MFLLLGNIFDNTRGKLRKIVFFLDLVFSLCLLILGTHSYVDLVGKDPDHGQWFTYGSGF